MSGPAPADNGVVDLGRSDADLNSPDSFTNGVPHATFKQMRDHDPVSWCEEEGGRGFWSVTRYDDVMTVSRQPELFSCEQGIRIEDMTPEEHEARRTMMEADAPEHTRYRRLVSKPFNRREVMTYESGLRTLARAVLDGVHGRSEIEFVHDIAQELPMRMLGRLLGVPEEDGPWLVEKGDALLGNTDPDFTSHPVGLVDTDEFRLIPFRSPAGLELFQYAREQAAKRREHPTDDVISDLLKPPPGETEPLTELEFNNFFTLLVAAGNDTTRYTMTAGIKALLERPEQLAELRDVIITGSNPALVNSAVEEILRWGTVTMHFRRTATQDVELSARTIRAGDKVVIWFMSADYDDRQFADPFSFNIHRSPNDHCAFGRLSPHLCLGAHLARLEIKILLEELLPRLVDIRQSGPVEYLRSNFIAGMKRLPVSLTWT
jgi:cytochrome P450